MTFAHPIAPGKESDDGSIRPPRAWAWLLGALILIEMGTHLGFRSPYLYSTEGQYGLERGTYGKYLGPNGEIIHFDAVNYWAVEYLFAGKYRGDHLSTIARPAYSLLAAALDDYLHPVYAGWLLNFLVWWAAALSAFPLARALGLGRAGALAFSLLAAAFPGFVDMAGQPMGYVLGYSLHFVFLACLAAWSRAPRPGAVPALIVLLILADATYEILGPLCLIPFLAWGWRPFGARRVLGSAAVLAAAKLAWDLLVVRACLHRASGSALDSRFLGLASLLASPAPMRVAGHLAWGLLLSGLFLVPLLGLAGLALRRGPMLRFCLTGLAAVALPLIAMGLIGEAQGPYLFYREGRVVAYFFPFLALPAAALCESLGRRLPGRWAALPLTALCAGQLLVSNADVAGTRALYHMFNYRQGYHPGEILAP
jgi:hypothetical protein